MDKLKEQEKSEEKYDVLSVDDIQQFDFKSDKVFDIEESYELIKFSSKPKVTKELIESREADKIIEKTSKLYLDDEYISKTTDIYDNLLNLIKRYNPNTELVKGLSETEKDKIYGIAEYLFDNFQKDLKLMNFKFDLSVDEWKFLINVFKNKIEYDHNEIFQMKELNDHYLKDTEKTFNTLSPHSKYVETVINVDDLIILFHLLTKYKVKGITKSYHSYSELLTKIGERIKLFNAYNVWIQRLSTDFQTWGGSLTVDDNVVKSETLEPTK